MLVEDKKLERRGAAWQTVLDMLPRKLSEEIEHIARSRRNMLSMISEIRLRVGGVSELSFIGGAVPLVIKITEDELNEIIYKACDGSLYAYRDTLSEGYIPMEGGIRVGVCGHARYDGGALVGVRGISSLVFRFPFGECAFANEVAELFLSTSRGGMLIYAPPAGGKTTALRSLVKELSRGVEARRVCVIDERCEFDPEDYIRCSVDILRGYKRAHGIELAVRTLSPEIIVIDEIASDEAEALRSVMRCGIPVIATAHASSMEELLRKPHISRLIDLGVFDLFVGITRTGDEFGYVATGIQGLK